MLVTMIDAIAMKKPASITHSHHHHGLYRNAQLHAILE